MAQPTIQNPADDEPTRTVSRQAVLSFFTDSLGIDASGVAEVRIEPSGVSAFMARGEIPEEDEDRLGRLKFRYV